MTNNIKYKIIVNPTSGRGNGGRIIPDLERHFHTQGVDFDLVQTERPLHAIELAQQAAQDGFDVVVGVGGDGTANEVINGLVQAKQASVVSHPPPPPHTSRCPTLESKPHSPRCS